MRRDITAALALLLTAAAVPAARAQGSSRSA